MGAIKLDELDADRLLLPELEDAVDRGGDDKVGPAGRMGQRSPIQPVKVTHLVTATWERVSRCMSDL